MSDTRSLTSVVIVSFNTRERLLRCLASLFAHQRGNFEVVVVDNASPDNSAAAIAAAYPAVRLIRNPTNRGFAPAANQGARSAIGDVIAFLNPDSTCDSDPFSAPAIFLCGQPDVGALGVKVLDPGGSLQLSVRRFPDLSVALFNRYSLLTRLLPHNAFSRRYLMTDWDHERLADVDWVSGACLLTTRNTLEKIGGFDEGYFWGFEDVDFCQRVHAAGLRVVYFPGAHVYHEIGGSSRTAPIRSLVARHRGMWRYYRRYLSSNTVIDAAIGAGITLRCAIQAAATFVKGRMEHRDEDRRDAISS